MNNITQKIKEKLNVVINILTGVANKRKDTDAILQLSLLNFEVELGAEDNLIKHLPEIKNRLFEIIDEIKFTINAEERYVLFPLPDIKKETYEMGKNYMKNFFEWLNPEDNFTPEQLMKIFEDELFRLDEAKELLEKLE
ncbi:MAG: hypothetical protein ACYCVH_07260 [Ignavibacteriaceae bacterium]